MSFHTFTRLLFAALITTNTTAQLLTHGNTQLPSCASNCPLLAQAEQACGGTTSATQAIWSCFCQSGYFTSLYNSPAGICDAVCTSPSDNQQVMTWFTTNCGKDDAASEHAAAGSGGGGGGGTTVVVVTSTSTSAIATGTGAVLPSTTASGGTVEPDVHTSSGRTWWDLHWKWVLMLIVLFAALLLLALLATCLKRRHDRKADQVREGFNTGITTRSTPMSIVPASANNITQDMSALGPSGSGRNSPARTRDAFMPYGYVYTRSESRLAAAAEARGDVGHGAQGRRSPLARGGTPVGELEKEVGFGGAAEGAPRGKKTRRVLVRERSVDEGRGDL
ncbi:hypothetical protein LTS16_004919 [Friedmanniomyces endolithicus]|nr:hypothetical protein LTR57_008935 [Friedmanniomyces endolithicus]KAK0994986.1 hypothetical protein LTS01_006917 [Friedmanniomyces endolithicus]KAK1047761.1 hypothetical protein LTS16_004919 [Friedmanniomyces endolithicus]